MNHFIKRVTLVALISIFSLSVYSQDFFEGDTKIYTEFTAQLSTGPITWILKDEIKKIGVKGDSTLYSFYRTILKQSEGRSDLLEIDSLTLFQFGDSLWAKGRVRHTMYYRVLLYDFTRNAGDTMAYFNPKLDHPFNRHTYKIDSIGTAVYEGIDREVQYITTLDPSLGYPIVNIKGIGSTIGVLSLVDNLAFVKLNNADVKMIAACIDDEVVYRNDFYADRNLGTKLCDENVFLDQLKANIGTHSIKNSVTIYPNPTSGIVYFRGEKIQTIRVMNALGILILQSSQDSIDLSNLSRGTYLVHVETAVGISHHKILLN